MNHRQLGKTGLFVSELCLGSMTFGIQSDIETSNAILDRAEAGGITFIDTADVYPAGNRVAQGQSETVGRSEEIIGKWMKHKRDRFIVATKGSGRMGPSPWDRGNSRKHLLEAVENSLRRLSTDYIDLYQLHTVDPHTPVEETLSALNDIVRSGKARYVGCSNYLAYQLALALGKSEMLHLVRFDCVQSRYNLLFREFERELLPLCAETGTGFIAYNPIAGGLLSGKHNWERAPEDGTRFTLGSSGTQYQDRYWHEREFKTVEQIRAVADEAGVSLVTLAVAWVLANPLVTAPIIGASSADQLLDSLAAVDFVLPHDVKTTLDDMTAAYRKGDAER